MCCLHACYYVLVGQGCNGLSKYALALRALWPPELSSYQGCRSFLGLSGSCSLASVSTHAHGPAPTQPR